MSNRVNFLIIGSAGVLSFFIMLSTQGLFRGLAVYLNQNTFLHPLIFAGFYWVYFKCAIYGQLILSVENTTQSKDETKLNEYLESITVIGTGFFWFVLSAALYGHSILNPWGSSGNIPMLSTFLSLAAVPYAILLYVGGSIFIGITVAAAFPFAVGFAALFASHPATDIVDKVKAPRPSGEVEKELAALMTRQDVTDEQMLAVFNELSSFGKLMWSTKLRMRLHKLRKLRETANLQSTVTEEETDLARDVHQRERRKRSRS